MYNDVLLQIFVFVVCMLERATTTRDVIYAVSWSVRQLTRELERQPTSQRVNVRTAPFSWPLGERHGVTCFFLRTVYSYV
jgi:hypothetical protein